MKGKNKVAFALFLSMMAGLVGCGNSDGAVFVQHVSDLSGMGGIAPGDRFGGMVVSENVSEIQKDEDKSVLELYVREGDDVKKGQKLFSYDVEELQLTVDKQQLQKEQLEVSIENLEIQIGDLEWERDRSSGRNKLEYTIQVQTLQVDLKEAELNLKAKDAELEKSIQILENSTVTSPVKGRIQSINETGKDNNGNTVPYISIQQAGSYRIKGTLNELQKGGIMEGDRIRIASRKDENQFWMGTVTLVDYENPTTGNQNNMYGMESDPMTSSSKYPFYVELDSSEGLILGQHLYLSLDTGEEETAGLNIGSSFVCFDENEKAFVWAENGRKKLEKRYITIGEYNAGRDTYPVLTGLTEDDYVAFPDPDLCRAGVPATRVAPQAEGGA